MAVKHDIVAAFPCVFKQGPRATLYVKGVAVCEENFLSANFGNAGIRVGGKIITVARHYMKFFVWENKLKILHVGHTITQKENVLGAFLRVKNFSTISLRLCESEITTILKKSPLILIFKY